MPAIKRVRLAGLIVIWVCQRSRGHVSVFLGSHHVLYRLDLGSRQLLRRRSWTRRHIVETALILSLPRMVPRLREPQDA